MLGIRITNTNKRTERSFVKFMEEVIQETGTHLGKKVQTVLQRNVTRAVEKALKSSSISESFDVPTYMMEGMALKIGKGFKIKGDTRYDTPDNIDELVDTFNSFGADFLRGYSEEAGALFDAVMSMGETIHKDVLESIGLAAMKHMRRVAYKSPKERRGANPQLNVPKLDAMTKELGGDIKLDKMLDEYTVGRWQGSYPVMRTGHLRDSINYKVTIDPTVAGKKKLKGVKAITYKWTHGGRTKGKQAVEDYNRSLEMAISLQIGPGVGKIPAPHYALVVNDGVGPGATDGSKRQMHYVPNPMKWASGGQGYMARGGSWRGFEGKHYMEDTGHWLVRETPRQRMNAENLAEIYASKAIAKLRGGVPGGMEGAVRSDLERIAIDAIKNQVSVSTNKLLADLAEHLLKGFDLGEG